MIIRNSNAFDFQRSLKSNVIFGIGHCASIRDDDTVDCPCLARLYEVLSFLPFLNFFLYIAQSLKRAASSFCDHSRLDPCLQGIENSKLFLSRHVRFLYFPLSICSSSHWRSPGCLGARIFIWFWLLGN